MDSGWARTIESNARIGAQSEATSTRADDVCAREDRAAAVRRGIMRPMAESIIAESLAAAYRSARLAGLGDS